MKRSSKKKSLLTNIKLESGNYPVKVFFEKRPGGRAAVGTKYLILRCPDRLDKRGKGEIWAWFMDWLRSLERKNPNVLSHLKRENYQNGHEIQVGQRVYSLQIEEEERKSASGQLDPKNNLLKLKIPNNLEEAARSKSIKTLCSRLVAQDFLPDITRRVKELNHAYFKKEIKAVKLKYNTSNWGSCSSNKIINLSTRLLFAPQVVIDYVIIHELAHLIEANHSKRFWALVEQAMPDYKKCEQWLKENGKQCDF